MANAVANSVSSMVGDGAVAMEDIPIAPTSALPLRLDMPGVNEGLFLPLPAFLPVSHATLPNVRFVHMRQYSRMIQRRLFKVRASAARRLPNSAERLEMSPPSTFDTLIL